MLGPSCGLWGVESIHVKITHRKHLSNPGWHDERWEAKILACLPSTPVLVGGAHKTGMNHIGYFLLTALSQALPQRPFPYRSPYCQNSVEEPWCDRSWSSSWELSENSLISFECFGLCKPRNPNRTLEVMQ